MLSMVARGDVCPSASGDGSRPCSGAAWSGTCHIWPPCRKSPDGVLRVGHLLTELRAGENRAARTVVPARIFHCFSAGALFLHPDSFPCILSLGSGFQPEFLTVLCWRDKETVLRFVAPCKGLVGWEQGSGVPRGPWGALCGTFPVTCMAGKRQLASFLQG